MDVRNVEFAQESIKTIHGMAKYYMKEDIPALDSGLR